MDLVATKPPKTHKELTSGELISELNKENASLYSENDLKTEFFHRFNNRLYQHCERFCLHHRLDMDVLKDVCQDTFLKALKKISSFKLVNTFDEKRINNTISAWLNKIAHNCFMDIFAEKAKFCTLDESYEEMLTEGDLAGEIEFFGLDNNSIKLQQAWDSLSNRERFILILCIEHNCLSNNHLPDDIIEWICFKLKIEKGNIRTIKSRALKKLKEQFLKS